MQGLYQCEATMLDWQNLSLYWGLGKEDMEGTREKGPSLPLPSGHPLLTLSTLPNLHLLSKSKMVATCFINNEDSLAQKEC